MGMYHLGLAGPVGRSPSAGTTYKIGAIFETWNGVTSAASQMSRDIEMMDLEMIAYIKTKPCANVPIPDRDGYAVAAKARQGDPAAILAVDGHLNKLPESDADCRALRIFYDAVWVPFVHDWESWWASHDSYFENFSTTATFNKLNARRADLIRIRASAIKAGFSFNGPAPVPPETGFFNDLGGGIGDLVVKLVKWFLLGAIGFGAIMLVFQYIRERTR